MCVCGEAEEVCGLCVCGEAEEGCARGEAEVCVYVCGEAGGMLTHRGPGE